MAPRLDDADLELSLSRKDEAKALERLGERFSQLRLTAGGLIGEGRLGPPLVVLFEGWDASGKGGAIRRLVAPLDARHVRVASFAAPTADEKRHHFLLRFASALPGWGGMTVFDRSWYGRVLVERVEGFATEAEWQRAYDEISSFEASLHAEGTVLVKCWMHISDAEQLRRFERRRDRPLKAWKLTDEDWRNRKRRADYEAAVDEMLARTDTPAAPWTVVPAESKRYARVAVLETVITALEAGLQAAGLDVPERSETHPRARFRNVRAALGPAVVVLALAGCGGSSRPPVSDACTGEPGSVQAALRAAPGDVRLPDGSLVSACVRDADTDAELQDVGALLTRVADDLAADDAELQLGFLVGAARRGAARTNGIATELVHRLEASGRRMGDTAGAELQRGVDAGEDHG